MNQLIAVLAIISFLIGVYVLHGQLVEANKNIRNVIKSVNSL